MPFICSICGEAAAQICARCTKDACSNHICEKCLRCSDCCECEIALDAPVHTPPPVVREMTAQLEREAAAAQPVEPLSPDDNLNPVSDTEPRP